MADRDAEFQDTDVILKHGLPDQAPIGARCAKDHCLVHYEQGGFSQTFHVVLLSVSKSGSAFEWGGLLHGPASSLEGLKSLVLAGKVNGSMSYW
jgi:hypothetical protein